MENNVLEYEKQQDDVTNQSKKVYSKLESAYAESEKLLNTIKYKQLELGKVKKKLWITIVVMAIVVFGVVILKRYI